LFIKERPNDKNQFFSVNYRFLLGPADLAWRDCRLHDSIDSKMESVKRTLSISQNRLIGSSELRWIGEEIAIAKFYRSVVVSMCIFCCNKSYRPFVKEKKT